MRGPGEDTEDASTAGLGERRRRREAERAREKAAGGTERPLTRREIRAREEALASGALTYGPDGLVPTSEFDRIEAESLSASSAADPDTGAAAGDRPPPGSRRARRMAERAQAARTAGSSVSPASAASRPSAPSAWSPARFRDDTVAGPARGQPRTEPEGRSRSARAAGSPLRESAYRRAAASPAPPPRSEVPPRQQEQVRPGHHRAELAERLAAPGREERRRIAEPGEPPIASQRPELSQRPGSGQRPGPSQRPHEPWAPSAPSPTGPQTALMVPVSRTSLRDKQALAPPPPRMGEGQGDRGRTGAPRRPVVRPPASIRATRGVSPEGELTSIQRAVREVNTAAEGILVAEGESGSPTAWGGAVELAPIDYDASQVATPESPSRLDPPARDDGASAAPGPDRAKASLDVPAFRPVTAPTPASAPARIEATPIPTPAEAPGPAGITPGAPEVGAPETAPATPGDPGGTEAPDAPAAADDAFGAFDLTPRWESLQQGAANADNDASTPLPAIPPRRTSALRPAQPSASPAEAYREEPEEPDEELLAEESRKTPIWLFMLQMIVLVLVMAVLGVLVYLYATGSLFGDDGAWGAAAGIRPPGWLVGR